LHEPHGVTSQKTPFFIVTAVKTSNLTNNLGLPYVENKGQVLRERQELRNKLIYQGNTLRGCRIMEC
jgi:hypothetical protein